MALEIRILSGARAGQRELFEKSVIAVGRHPLSDLRFDPEADLDVSTRHAEIRGLDGRYVIHDNTSTNGTFVNGQRILPDRELHDGDRIAFGDRGPQVMVRFVAARPSVERPPPVTRETPPRDAAAAPPSPAPSPPPAPPPRSSTTERVAIAVRERTSWLTRLLAAAVVVLTAGIGIAFWLGHRSSEAQVNELRQLLAQNAQAASALEARLQAMADTNFARALELQSDSLRARVARTPAASAGTIDSIRAALEAQYQLLTMDVPTINTRNAPAVAILYSEIKGTAYGATAFAVTTDGLLVTNRHNVVDADGTPATRLAVTFRDTRDVLPAHVVRVSADSAVDLALVQVDRPGPFPVVHGISGGADAAPEGAPVVTIGYPLINDLVMGGNGPETVAKSTLDPGTVSKRVPSILQIDAYASHGSSGSPVFNARGNVVGVVYGGPSESNGHIVYAVPASKLADFLPPRARGLIR